MLGTPIIAGSDAVRIDAVGQVISRPTLTAVDRPIVRHSAQFRSGLFENQKID